MCAIGRYENVNHNAENTSTAENLMRSAYAPVISAVVMAANVSWNITKMYSGIATPLLKVSTVSPA